MSKDKAEVMMSIQQIKHICLTDRNIKRTRPTIITQLEIFNVHDLTLEEVFEIGRSFYTDGDRRVRIILQHRF